MWELIKEREIVKTKGVLQKVLVLVLTCFICSAHSAEDPLVGVWSGFDSSGEIASLVFYANGAVTFIRGDLVLDPKSVGGSLIWRIDRTKTPMHLDLIGTKATGEQLTLPFIVRFITDRKIQVKMAEDMKTRPVAFSENEDRNQMVLDKE